VRLNENSKFFLRLGTGLCVLTGSVLLVSAPKDPFTVHDKAYYATPEVTNFVRPGLVIKVTGVDIAADGTVKARIKLTDPKGQPLDRDGILAPGSVSTSLILARIPKGATQYLSYTVRSQTSPITGVTAVQAGTDTGGTWTKVADGEYSYTFGLKLPAGYDKTVTHSIGAYGSRNLSEFDMGTQYDDDVYNFVPDGSAVKTVRDVVRSATCNKCHSQMAFHGGSRRTMELCVLCHQPQSVDPDTGNSVDMPVMTHKIHMGANLPSVKAGKKYVIIGNAQSAHDYSNVNFPAAPQSCTACHEAGAAQTAAYQKPNRVACGACHDNVNFNTGENHANLPQPTDNLCANCHQPKGELDFDVSIAGAHTVPRLSGMLPGVVFEILSVSDTAPGQRPTVVCTLKDKSGKPILPASMLRLSLHLAGPNSDYTTYVTEDATKADSAPDGRFWWTFNTAIPANATGSMTIGLEGRREVTLLPGTTKQQVVRDTGANKQIYFSVDGSKVEPRRKVVATEKCNSCHGALAMHGDGRNRVEQCVICHNPTKVSGTGATAVSVDMRVMIHKIHTGAELSRPYNIGSSFKAQEFGYPGDRRNCGQCHVNGSEQLPLSDARIDVADPAGPLNPLGPAAAACTGCHDTIQAASHALANTPKGSETCGACHGKTSDFSVDKLHAH
jgi:OmcA/MtrC family decaheme c-type cytochrome